MKHLIVLLLLVSLLSGCAAPALPEESTPPETAVLSSAEPSRQEPETAEAETSAPEATAAPAETEPPAPEAGLLDTAEPLGEGMYLARCPGLSGIPYGDFYPFCGDLLAVWTRYDEQTEETSCRLRRISLQDGTALADLSFPDWEFDPPQIYGDRIALCSRQQGLICILDEGLQVCESFRVQPGDGLWYVGSDLHTLYHVEDSSRILVLDPDTGEERELFRDAGRLFYMNRTDRGLFFTCTDPETQLTDVGFLNFYTGRVELLPEADGFSRISLAGNYWLGNVLTDYDIYCFGRGRDIRLCRDETQTLSILSDGRLRGGGWGELRLYENDGRFFSACHPYEEERYCLSEYLLPWEAAGGYLFFRFQDLEAAPAQLILWLPEQGEGESLTLFTPEEWRKSREEALSEPALRDRARALSERFGVEIHISRDCPTEASGFTCQQVTDGAAISAGLDLLEQALSIYPENFFPQLAYDTFQTTDIYLMGTLTADEFLGEGSSYAGFSNSSDGRNNIVVDIGLVNEGSYHHEISHILDRRLAWDHELRPEALFSEEGWSALNPAGFSYTESYADFWEEENPYTSDGWFIDAYSRISATEDRARIFENAASGWELTFRDAPGLQAKLDYYCRCIRDTFCTEGWPEELPWETTLRLASEAA